MCGPTPESSHHLKILTNILKLLSDPESKAFKVLQRMDSYVESPAKILLHVSSIAVSISSTLSLNLCSLIVPIISLKISRSQSRYKRHGPSITHVPVLEQIKPIRSNIHMTTLAHPVRKHKEMITIVINTSYGLRTDDPDNWAPPLD